MYHIQLSRRMALCVLVLSIFFTNINLYAAGTAYPNWNLINVGKQTRNLTTDYDGTGAVIGAGSILGNVSNTSLTINGRTVSTDSDPVTAAGNGSAYVVGGAGYIGQFTNNSVNITDSTIRGRDIIGGAAFLENVDNRLQSVTASNNTVLIKNSTTEESTVPNGGSVIGGFAAYANTATDYNRVTVDGSTINGNVIGAMVLFTPIEHIDYEGDTRLTSESHTTDNNIVYITNNSNVTGTAAAVFGSQSAQGNQLIIDHSTVDTATVVMENPARVHMGDASNLLSNNTLIIRNDATVNNGVAAIDAFFTNTTGNTLLIDNTTNVSGKIRTVFMQDNSREQNAYFGSVTGNNLIYQNIASAVTADELGSALNLSGVANQNTVLVNNVSAGLTVNRPALVLEKLDFGNLATQNLISVKDLTGAATNVNATLNSSYGFVYGGAVYDYTLQKNDETTVPTPDSEGNLPEAFTNVPDIESKSNPDTISADGNVVTIKKSQVKSNIAGGIAGQIQEIHYATWEYDPGTDGTDPSDDQYYQTQVHKIGNTITTSKYDCGNDGTCDYSSPIETNSEDVTEFDGKVASASNNTVILEDSEIDGTVYGGYLFGADLKSSNAQTRNNTVIIRGNTTLTAASKIYGGSSYWGQTTNKLVFDRVSDGAGGYITFIKKDQFKNFNPTWHINADLNTRIHFDFNEVRALVNVDNSIGEGTAIIIKTKTANDLTDVEQDGVLTDLVDSAIDLSKKREGVYSFSLTPVKSGSDVGWRLTSAKDKHNVELYGQVPLVGMVLAAEGVDTLSRTFEEAWESDADHNVFLNGGYDHTRYITGSGFDLDAGIAQAGLWTKLTSDWIGGLFAKYSAGTYKTFPLDAKGKASAYGGGLMSSFAYSEMGHLEASAEVGYMHLDFDSSALASTLKTSGLYYGLMGGIVQGLSENWDLLARIQYLHKNSDDMEDNLNQKIKYSAMNSLSLKAGTSYRFREIEWQGLVPMVAAFGLYEFAGDSKVDVQNLSNSSASLKGFSGRADVGLTFDNTQRGSLLPMISQLTVFGQAGNRRGFGAEINISVQF